MKINFKPLKRAVALVIALCALLALCTACSSEPPVPDPILECGEEKMPLYFYEFMLSRMKGNLARSKYPVGESSFWSTKIEETGETYEEYYNRSIFETCRKYFAAAVLFDELGLTLPKSVLASIDDEIAFYIDYDGDGDKNALNELIAPYGVDAETLRECYIIGNKYEYLISYLYGGGELIADSVREEYYQDSYYCFKQVLIAKFYYKYRQDKYGNMIYFDKETGYPIYDTENGHFQYDENGARLKDSYGQPMYFDDEGNVLYDTEKGLPAVVLDDKGNPIQYEYTAEEIEAQKQLALELSESLTDGNFAAFEAKIEEHKLVIGEVNEFADGYYLSEIEDAGYTGDVEYLSDILAMLDQMEVGEIGYYESDAGYHVIMRYDLEVGKYTDKDYKSWFASLDAHIIGDLFDLRIAEILERISVNEENLAKARSIKELGVNFDY